MPNRDEAKRVILKIVAISGGRLEAKTRLNKAFYAAHVIYWRERQGILTDYPVVKLPEGPGIDNLDDLLEELVSEGALEVFEEPKGPFVQTVLVLKASVKVDPADPEYEPIRKAVVWVKRLSTAQLKRVTHRKPSYDAQARIGYEQPIYLDALSEDELEQIRATCQEVDEAFRSALGTGG